MQEACLFKSERGLGGERRRRTCFQGSRFDSGKAWDQWASDRLDDDIRVQCFPQLGCASEQNASDLQIPYITKLS